MMTTETMHTCPRCREPLTTAHFKDVDIESCAGCRGVLVSQNRVLRLLETMTNQIKNDIDWNMPLVAVPDAGGGLACPGCAKAMSHYGYMNTNWVMIDTCLTCGLLWADMDQLGMMGLLFARSQRRAERIRMSRYEPPSTAPNIRANRLGSVIANTLLG